jgi:hypothetical protein
MRQIWVVLLLSVLAFGQGERGTFNGTGTDSSGALVPDAVVKAQNKQTNVETTASTTSAGVYRLPLLPPGNYRLTVAAPGFKTVVRDNVNLSVAQTLTIDFALEVGAITEQST